MRSTIYIRDKCYTKETVLLELELLSKLQQLSTEKETTVSELINHLLSKGIKNAHES